jgi:DNA-binding XRE family transcriptional regulator
MSNAFCTITVKDIHNPLVGKKQIVAHEETIDTLAERLEAAMAARGTNPNKVANAVGIERQTLYAVASGKTQKLLWETCVKVAAHLGIRPEWLNDGELPMHPAPKLRDDDEIQLIENYRHLSDAHRKDLRDFAAKWAEEDDPTPSKSRPFTTRIPNRKQ